MAYLEPLSPDTRHLMENPPLFPLLIGLAVLVLIVWLLRRKSGPAEAPLPLHQAPKTLDEIRRFGQTAKTAEDRRQQVLRTGQTASALILEATETGVAEHDWDEDSNTPYDPTQARPQVHLRVRVEPADSLPFDTTLTEFVPYALVAALRAGQRVTVRYLPADHAAVALER